MDHGVYVYFPYVAFVRMRCELKGLAFCFVLLPSLAFYPFNVLLLPGCLVFAVTSFGVICLNGHSVGIAWLNATFNDFIWRDTLFARKTDEILKY